MKKGPVIAVFVAIGLTIVIFMAPTTEKVQPKEAPKTEQTNNTDSDKTLLLNKKVDEAVEIINNANGAPMRGITMLREVIEEEPNHVKANYWLGEFSLMSGQLEKAAPRFIKVLEVDPANADAAKSLVTVYIELQEIEKAKDVITVFETKNPNHEAVAEMNNMLNNI